MLNHKPVYSLILEAHTTASKLVIVIVLLYNYKIK